MENFEGLVKLAESAEQTIERYKRTGKPAQSVLRAMAKGFGLAPFLIAGQPITAGVLQTNQNELLRQGIKYPNALRTGDITKPVSPWVAALLLGGGFQGYGIQKHTRDIYNKLIEMNKAHKLKRKK